MKKIFTTKKVSEDHYEAEEVIIWCFDFRFNDALNNFIKGKKVDIISIAGGAKNLASPESEEDSQFILRQIWASLKLHSPKKIVLMAHTDCGAYGGIKESNFYINELNKAELNLRKYFDGIKIQKIFIDADGNIWEI